MAWTSLLIRAFESRVQRRISLNNLSSLLGHARTFLAKVLGHPRGPRVGDLFEAQLKAGDEHPGDLYHQAFERAVNDPVRILASNRRRQDLMASPFLVAHAPRLLALIEAGPSAECPWRSQLDRIRQYERLRFKSRQASQDKLEWAIATAIALLERWPARPAAALADLACALTSLAVTYMVGGRLDDSLDALLLAYPLARFNKNPLAEGLWFQKSAYLLVRLDRCDRAAEYIRDASMLFLAAAATRDQARTLVDLGHVLSRAQLSVEACRYLSYALGLLPRNDREYLCAAHQILAGNLARIGRLEEATTHLEKACTFASESEVLLAAIHWSRAKFYLESGIDASAVEAFQASLRYQRSHGNPADFVAVSLEYAAVLLKNKNRPELEKLAAEVALHLAALPCDSAVREAAEDFAALVRMGSLTQLALRELHSKLPDQGGSTEREGGRQKGHPPGWISQPISDWSPVGLAALLFGGSGSLADSTE